MELDKDSSKDLMEAFWDLRDEIEHSLLVLVKEPCEEGINELFRAIHNIKGNAGMLGLTRIVDFTHDIEEVAGGLRQGKYALTDGVCETMLLALDRLHDLHQQELYGKKFDYLRIDELKILFQKMAVAKGDEVNEIALQALNTMGAGIAEVNIGQLSRPESHHPFSIEALPEEQREEKKLHDLFFFQELALQLDLKNEGWEGRSIQMFDWAMKMNLLSGNLVDAEQLAAATYIHDLGLALLPRKYWEGKLDLSPQELEFVKNHPDWGYNLLVRIPGWEEAATIVHHHRECIDGSGYPSGLKGNEIHPGAKILAILDTFFLLTKGRVDSSVRHSTVRAVSTINARVDTQFEGMWVQCFNHMIRKELQYGNV